MSFLGETLVPSASAIRESAKTVIGMTLHITTAVGKIRLIESWIKKNRIFAIILNPPSGRFPRGRQGIRRRLLLKRYLRRSKRVLV